MKRKRMAQGSFPRSKSQREDTSSASREGIPMRTFTYDTLAPTDFRLLRIRKGSSFDGIQCDIQHFSFDRAPPYVAISYRWGSPEYPYGLPLGPKVLPVMSNAWWALLHLRKHGVDRYVWLDAVCIDQDNVKERNAQVQLMGDIYARADEVIVWLGKGDAKTDAAFETMNKLVRLRLPKRGRESYARLKHTILPLLQNTFWRRTWIIQEVLFAQKLILVCGSKQTEWSSWEMFINDVLPTLDRGYHGMTGTAQESTASIEITIIQGLIAFRRILHQPFDSQYQGITLEALLRTYKHSACSDPLDKIYGLLALYNRGNLRPFSVDYSRSVEDLLIYSLGHISQRAQGLILDVSVFELLLATLRVRAARSSFHCWLRPRVKFDRPAAVFTCRLDTEEMVRMGMGTTTVFKVSTIAAGWMLPVSGATREDLGVWLGRFARDGTHLWRVADFLFQHRRLFRSFAVSTANHASNGLISKAELNAHLIYNTAERRAISEMMERFYRTQVIMGRRVDEPKVFRDNCGRIGVACSAAQEGDILCSRLGEYDSMRLFVLRPLDSDTYARLHGRPLGGLKLYTVIGIALLVTGPESAPYRFPESLLRFQLFFDPLSALSLSMPIPPPLESGDRTIILRRDSSPEGDRAVEPPYLFDSKGFPQTSQ